MHTKLKLPLALAVLATIVVVAYFVYTRVAVHSASYEAGREANRFMSVAVTASRAAQTATREAQAVLNEATFKNNRAELSEKAGAAAKLSRTAAAQYRLAAERAGAAAKVATSEEARAYWVLRHDALAKRAETAEAAAEGYGIAADPSIADLATVFTRMQPFVEQAEAARLESVRLTAEADAYQDAHRAEF